MPVRLTPEQYARKHASRLKNAIPEIQEGIEAVTTSPTALAADKSDKMLANLTRAVQSGKWAARLRSVSLEDWKSAAIKKGLNRIAGGIDEAHDKQVAFAAELFPFENALMSEIDRMPDLTIEDSISRATKWIRGMAEFERK